MNSIFTKTKHVQNQKRMASRQQFTENRLHTIVQNINSQNVEIITGECFFFCSNMMS